MQTPTPTPAAAPLWCAGGAAAASLYAEGDAVRGIAACASCHGKAGQGDVAQRGPALHGQQALYVTSQLQDYAARSRHMKIGAAVEQMSVLAAKLTAEEMSDLGTWLQCLH